VKTLTSMGHYAEGPGKFTRWTILRMRRERLTTKQLSVAS
jgi:hypothetical protein